MLAPRHLEVPPAFAVPDLGRRASPAPGVPSRCRWTLHDTADHDLGRAGAEVAHDPDRGWRVVLPPGPQLPARALHRPGGPSPPAEVRRLLAAWLRGRPLEPRVTVAVESAPLAVVTGDDGTPVVVVSEDDVRVCHADGTVAHRRELVLTATSDTRERDLDAVEVALVAAGARRRPSGDPASAAAAPTVPAEDATVAVVLQATLADGLERLLGADPHARLGEDPEGVHQLRVATRRLRANLRTWRDQLDPGWVTDLRAELAWLASLLGQVRDADVRELRLRGHLEELGWPEDAGAVLAHARALAEPARHEVQRALDDPRYVGLLDRLRDAVDTPPLAPGPASTPAGTVVLDVVRRSWRQLRDEVLALPTPATDASLHAVRLRTKRLRFAAEAAAPFVGPAASRTAAAAEALQDVLGELQDTVVTRAWLAAAARTRPELAFRCGELAGLEHARAVAARAAWHASWSQLCRPRYRRWFRRERSDRR